MSLCQQTTWDVERWRDGVVIKYFTSASVTNMGLSSEYSAGCPLRACLKVAGCTTLEYNRKKHVGSEWFEKIFSFWGLLWCLGNPNHSMTISYPPVVQMESEEVQAPACPTYHQFGSGLCPRRKPAGRIVFTCTW